MLIRIAAEWLSETVHAAENITDSSLSLSMALGEESEELLDPPKVKAGFIYLAGAARCYLTYRRRPLMRA